jgi:methionyl-tRNA formyltransferase
MTPSKKILFFGNERLVSGLPSTTAPTLRDLIDAGYEIVGVVSHHAGGQSRNDRALEVAAIAEAEGIPVFLPHTPAEIIDELRGLGADIAVLSSYGRIVPKEVIDLFPLGIVNIHPSLLPKYRGPTPIESAILSGDTSAGVSIMQITPEMDAGPVYAQESIDLSGHEDKFELYDRLSTIGSQLLLRTLPSILDGSLLPAPQDESRATYSRLLRKEDAMIDPSAISATDAERRVRAYLGFPKTKITLYEQTVIITKAHVSSTPGGLSVECQDGDYLVIDELIGPSGRRMAGRDFKNGYAAGA